MSNKLKGYPNIIFIIYHSSESHYSTFLNNCFWFFLIKIVLTFVKNLNNLKQFQVIYNIYHFNKCTGQTANPLCTKSTIVLKNDCFFLRHFVVHMSQVQDKPIISYDTCALHAVRSTGHIRHKRKMDENI